MSENIQKLMDNLRTLQQEAVAIQVESIRRRAMYPDLAAMDKRTSQISMAQASLPIAQTDDEKVHLLRHIYMLRKELRKREAKTQ